MNLQQQLLNSSKESRKKICIQKDDDKSRLTCILEADETKRLRMEGIEPRIHEDHTAEKGDNSLHHDIVVAREIGHPQAYQEQAAVDPRGSRTCVCAVTYDAGVAHAGEKGELTFCRGTV